MICFVASEKRVSPNLMVHGRIANGNCTCGVRHSDRAGPTGRKKSFDEARWAAIKEQKRKREAFAKKKAGQLRLHD